MRRSASCNYHENISNHGVVMVAERRLYESGEEGAISSPDYPSYYGIKKNYYWRIEVPEGK